MTKTLYFVHQGNLKKICNIKKEACVILLDENQIKKGNFAYLENYTQRVLNKAGKIRYGYNTGLIQQWAFRKLGNRKSVAEELIFDDISLWHPIEFFFTADVDQMGFSLSIPGITLLIDVISTILDEKTPSRVVIENDKGQLNQIIYKVCKKRKIPCVSLKLATKEKSFFSSVSYNEFILRNYIHARIMLRRIIAGLFCKKAPSQPIIVLTSDRFSREGDKTDYFWGPIIKEIKKRRLGYKMVEYDRIDASNSLINLIKRYVPQKFESQFIGTYYNKTCLQKAKKIEIFLRNKYFELDKNHHFRESFIYEGIRFYDILNPRLRKIFLSLAAYVADVYALAEAIIEKENPSILVVDHEKNFYGRALITYAHRKKIPSICLEGESVYDNNAYLIHIPIKEVSDEKSLLWRPVPTVKMMWSAYSKKWHENKNFIPKKRMKIVGAPKYDFLKEMNANDRMEIRKKYGLKENDLLVLIVTVFLPNEEEYIKNILESLSNKSNIKVIIKMHLTDSALRKHKWGAMLNQYNIKGSAVQFENTSKLIHASELIITYPSTLVYECILLNKKTVIFGSKADFSQPYIKDGLLKLYTDFDEMKKAIEENLNSKKETDPALRREFIREYLFSEDGRSSQRVVSEIQSLIKQKGISQNI